MAMYFPRILKVAILPFNGLFEVARDTYGRLQVIGGLEADYLRLLSSSLNFDVEVLEPPDGEWGRETTNGSWTGLVGMVLQKNAHIALGGIAVTEKRAKVIHYTAPYRFTYLTFATNLPSPLPRLTTFLYPFTVHLWIALGVLILAMPFVFRQLLRHRMSLANHFFETIKSLVYEPMVIPKSLSDRSLLGSWLIATMIVTYSYAATLLSFLTIPLVEPGVQNLKELSLLVKQGKFRAGCFKGTNVANILRASQHKSIAMLAHHILSNGHDLEPTRENIEDFFKEENSALIAPEVFFQMNFPNSLRIAPEALKCTAISMVTLKTFCCKQALDDKINRIFESGLSQQIVKRVLAKIEIRNSLNVTRVDQRTMALRLEDLSGAFILLLMGIILALIALLLEILVLSRF